MATSAEIEAFQLRGLFLRKNFLPAEKVARARQSAFDYFEKEGLWRDGDWRLDELSPLERGAATPRLVRGLNSRKEIVELIGEEVRGGVAELLDNGATFTFSDKVQVLLTLPNAENWTVPHRNWHVDLPRCAGGGTPGVQIFTFLDVVEPSGGGTLVVAGSHRLANENGRISSAQVKKILKRETYFRELTSEEGAARRRFLQEPATIGDVEVQVLELHGEPGNVYFADPRLLHTVAPNARDKPRLMITQRFLLESIREESATE